MTDTIRAITFGAASAALLAACSSSPSADEEMADWREDARLGEQVDRICFSDNIDNFRMTTRNTVIVEKGVNDEYLIETFNNCNDLDFAQSLSFDTFPGASCVTKGDSIYAYDSAFGPQDGDIPPIRCPISAIYEWNEDAAEEEDEAGSES